MKQDTPPSDDFPVYRPITEMMTVDFLFDKKGGAWLLHNKPLPDFLHWAEYDGEMETLTLVSYDGKVQNLGTKIPVGSGHYIEKAMEITTMYVDKGKIQDFQIIPIISRGTTVN